MRKLDVCATALVAFGALSCVAGEGAGWASEGPGEEKGAIRVSVRNLGAAIEVDRIVVVLSPHRPGNQPEYALVKPGPGDVWSQTIQGIQGGSYEAIAKAYNASSDLIFESNPSASFTISATSVPDVHLFLFELPAGSEVDTPYINSLIFSDAPVVALPVTITVGGRGGNPDGPLALTGSGDGSFTQTPDDARTGASIEWTPGQTGMQEVSLIVSDIDGNTSTVVITVDVGLGKGDVNFLISFNHAPTTAILSESVQSVAGAKVTIEAKYFDPEHNPTGPPDEQTVLYKWDFTACDLAGLAFDTARSSPPGDLTTTVDSNGGETHTFFLAAEDETQSYECDALLSLRDQTSPSSSREQVLHIKVEAFDLILPVKCEKDFGDCDGDPQNGCETELLANQQHCGACGNACDAYEQCMEGGCVDYQRAEWPLPPDSPTALSVQEAAPGEDVIVDALTGLMWRAAPPASVGSLAEGKTHCEGLSWGSFDDWRLPSVIEAITFVDHSKPYPAFDGNIFTFLPESQLNSANYITSTPVIGEDTTWSPIYSVGWIGQNNTPVVAFCVRGGSILPGTPRYLLEEDGTTVYATRTDLTWRRASAGPMDWNAAKTHCESESGWRLPTAKELLSIVDYRQQGPADRKSVV